MVRNKTAIITGAGGGIGKAISVEFAKQGYDLILVSKTRSELKKTSKLASDHSNNVKALSLDVTDYTKIKQAFAKNLKMGSFVLINAAGVISPIGPFKKNNIMEWARCVEVNLIGTANVIHALLPYMNTKRGNVIINFSGGGAFYPRSGFSSYSVSKSGVVRLTECLAEELKQKNIRVNAVAPGAINTKMFKEMFAAGKGNVGEEKWSSLLKQKREGGENPEIVAKLCLWIASGNSKNVTGKTIHAVHDNWSAWKTDKIKKLQKSQYLTMRRIDKYTLERLDQEKL